MYFDIYHTFQGPTDLYMLDEKYLHFGHVTVARWKEITNDAFISSRLEGEQIGYQCLKTDGYKIPISFEHLSIEKRVGIIHTLEETE